MGAQNNKCHPLALLASAVSNDLEGGGGVVDANGVVWEVQSDVDGRPRCATGRHDPAPCRAHQGWVRK